MSWKFALVLSVFGPALAAQPALEGTVTDPIRHTGIAGVSVRLTSPNHPEHETTPDVWVAFKKAIDARIAFTFPPDHYQSAYKRARLDNGVEVSAPLFIEAGDTVTVDLDLLQVIRPLSRADQ